MTTDAFAELTSRAVQPATCSRCGGECLRGWRREPVCDPCAEAARVAELESENARHVAHVVAQRLRGWHRAVPPRFKWATDDDPAQLEERVDPVALRKVRGLSMDPLTLTGPSGSGKTSLAIALVSRWAQGLGLEYPRTLDFVSTTRLERAARRHRLGDDEPDEIRRALSVDLLVLDDLGMERSRFGVEAIVHVIDERHNQDLVTLATTALDDGQIAETYGIGIARRLVERRVLRMQVARP